jgi:GNAT superfamily N-acetyltransferase
VPETKKKISEKPIISEISKELDFSTFDSGRPSINDYLKEYALQNHRSGRAKTYVACIDNNRVVGFYSLCPAEISYKQTVVPLKAGQPKGQRIPVLKLAQLGIDIDYQGKGLGKALLKDAILNCYQAAQKVGGRAIIIDALDEDVMNFYIKLGFEIAIPESKTLMLKISTIEKSLKN